MNATVLTSLLFVVFAFSGSTAAYAKHSSRVSLPSYERKVASIEIQEKSNGNVLLNWMMAQFGRLSDFLWAAIRISSSGNEAIKSTSTGALPNQEASFA